MMDAIDVLARIPFHEASMVGKEYQDGHYQPITNISVSGKKDTLFFNRYGGKGCVVVLCLVISMLLFKAATVSYKKVWLLNKKL